jgi:hypothetical protein
MDTALTYQGRLSDGDGPVDGICDLTFRLYDAEGSGEPPQGGRLLGTEVLEGVEVQAGVFAVRLDYGSAAFNGQARWLEVELDCGAGAAVLSPRQELTAAPYALYAWAGPFWSLAGNAGTDPTSQYLGTTDAVSLTLAVSGTAALRIEPASDADYGYSPNLIGGWGGNEVAAGVAGATIAGGGSATGCGLPDVDPCPNRVTEQFGTIGGGVINEARGRFATVGGGRGNLASGCSATVGGGTDNVASSLAATVGGGVASIAGGEYATVSGGYQNTAGGSWTTVGGGNRNQAIYDYATVGGGMGNWASGEYATVGGGYENMASGYAAMVGGGSHNEASGDRSTVGGGVLNLAEGRISSAAGARAKALHDGAFVWNGCGDFCQIPQSTIPFTSTAANQFLVRAQGGVGLGTNAPQNQLHVQESINEAATPWNHVAQIENTSTYSSPDVLALKVGTTGDPDGRVNFVTFFKGGENNPIAAIEGDGSGGVTYRTSGSDYAEWLPRLDPEEGIEPGDVVGVFGGRVSKRTLGAERVMVVSRAPIVLANDPGEEQAALFEKVAFLGQVAVKVWGPMAVGDWIVASGLEDGSGVAVAAEALTAEGWGQVVGQAWEASDEAGLKEVRVVVGLSGPNPSLVGLVERVESLEGRLAALEAAVAGLAATGAGGRP